MENIILNESRNITQNKTKIKIQYFLYSQESMIQILCDEKKNKIQTNNIEIAVVLRRSV